MNLFSLNIKQIRARFWSSTTNILLFASGIAVISFVFSIREQVENQLNKNVGGIDLVVGAKGSPLQLIMSGIYHIDYPTGNINYKEALELAENPLVKYVVPLSLGDNYQGFRIVGTDLSYPTLYQASLKKGKWWKKSFEATLGAKVAGKTGLNVGDKFESVHGFISNVGHVHDDQTYTVTGIMEPTGSVIDQLILTGIESVWEAHEHNDGHNESEYSHNHDECEHHHEHGEEHDHENTNDDSHEKEITVLLVKYTNPMGAITLPRLINTSTNMQAASPVQELNRLYSIMGVGIQAINLIAVFIIVISAFSLFISLINSLKERKYELALIRVMGGSRGKLFALVMLEGLSIALIGCITGLLLAKIGVIWMSFYAENNYHYNLLQWISQNDFYLLLASLSIGLIAALFPAIKATKTEISKTLSE